MTLSELIRNRKPGKSATAIPAISATQLRECIGPVAGIATVAVASPENRSIAPELCILVSEVCRTYGCSPSEIAEAQECAARAPVAARESFLLMAAEMACSNAR
jgi:hypothetical protein